MPISSIVYIRSAKIIINFAVISMMPGSKGQNVVLACKIRHLNLGPAKHEEVAIYAVNMRIPNVCRIARVTL